MNKTKKDLRYSENVKGRFYVNKKCIVCGKCVALAPYNFAYLRGDKHPYIKKQPETREELKACQEAREKCPVDAIDDDLRT